MSSAQVYQRFAAQPYRPVPVAGAEFIVRRFTKDGKLASEIPFMYREIAEELLAKHQARGDHAELFISPKGE